MKAYRFYDETVTEFEKKQPTDQRPEKVQDELMGFLADRLKVYLRERGIRHDHVEAVFSLNGEDDLVRFIARVDALSRFLASVEGENLLAAYKRASNIVAIEEKGKMSHSMAKLRSINFSKMKSVRFSMRS